jgi:uncharacterized SAM-binding protein YcdF (DUF218 family)
MSNNKWYYSKRELNCMKKILKIAVTIIAIIFLVWFIAPVILYRVINPGNILGILICLYFIFRFGFCKSYRKIRSAFRSKKIAKLFWNVANLCMVLFAVYAVVISGLMVYYSTIPPVESSTAVVLGAQVRNGKASALLQQRIDAGEQYLNSNKNSVAVVTGGQGDDEAMSEAKCMYDNITADGIKSDRIYMEDKAENTYENIKFSYNIIKENNLNKNLAIVTDSYHQLRARLIAYKQNINTKIGAVNTHNNKIGIINYPTYFVREWIAVPVELLK